MINNKEKKAKIESISEEIYVLNVTVVITTQCFCF